MHREGINKSSLPLCYMEKAIVTFLNPDNGDKVIFSFKFDKENDTLDYNPTFKIKNTKDGDNNLIKTLSSIFIDTLNGTEDTSSDNSGESSIRNSDSE